MLFRALIVSLGYLWLNLRILFASNSLKLCSSYFSSPVLAIIVKNEKKNAFLKINFYIKISKNFNFSNLGSNCLDIWQFFRNFLAFQKASFQHFTITCNWDSLILPAVVSPGWTLRYEGRETTASNRLLFH